MAEPLRQQQRPIRHANTPVRAWCHAHIDAPRHCRTPRPKTMPNRKRNRLPCGRRYPFRSEYSPRAARPTYRLVSAWSMTEGLKVNAKIGSSHLLISGAEPKDWPIVINNGIRTLEFTALHPDTLCDLVMCLAAIFRSRVCIRWDGGARISEHSQHTFRVLPGTR